MSGVLSLSRHAALPAVAIVCSLQEFPRVLRSWRKGSSSDVGEGGERAGLRNEQALSSLEIGQTLSILQSTPALGICGKAFREKIAEPRQALRRNS